MNVAEHGVNMGRFLGDRRDERVWTVAREERGTYWTGEGQNALEVVYVEFASEPSRSQVSKLWHERQGRRAAPVLLVAAWPASDASRAWLCGPIGEDPPMAVRDLGQAERLAAQALTEPSRTFAIQYLNGALAEVDDPLPGIRNDGLLATHELREGVRLRRDWTAACERSRPLVNLRDRALVEGLGYHIDQRVNHAVLRAADGEEIRAVAVFLDRGERPDRPSARFDQRTPVTHALTLADREGLRWVVAVRGSTLRLYSTATSGAAGQRGRTETFVELDLPLLADKHAGYLTLLFAADALATGGTFDEIAAASRDFTTKLSERMRERIYEHTIPDLARAIAQRHDGPLDKASLDTIYHAAMTVLFRLLFVAYAEDQRLLPYAASEDYRANSLKALAQRFAHRINEGEALGFRNPFFAADDAFNEDGTDELWSRCRSLFQAVDRGNAGWDIPAYNGGLFSETSPEGQRIAALTLTNAEFGPALTALVLDRTPDGGVGPIDFRSLSVREFGSIYEGLLENELAVAEDDLTLRMSTTLQAEVYVPAAPDEPVAVSAGDVYLHDKSGARKSSGSYFTPEFAVDRLISAALAPLLSAHLDKVATLAEAGDDVEAASLLLDFRVADIAMGSGHFLTAAVDAIEAAVTSLLAERPLPHFQSQLDALRAAARESLGDAADRYEIEDSQLVRRLIARKCIYGVDLNPISVELARVSLWIHTFVPGLPLSFLDRTLIVGNSLIGIASVQEAVDELTTHGSQAGLFDDPIREAFAAAEEPLRRLGVISDTSLAEIAEAQAAAASVEVAVKKVRDAVDLLVAHRLGEVSMPVDFAVDRFPKEVIEQSGQLAQALQTLHFPTAFPEVFLRERGGFDVVVGNPPWDKVRHESQQFWVTRYPGLNALPAAERESKIAELRRERPSDAEAEDAERASREQLQDYVGQAYSHQGRGHHEFAKLFVERALTVTGDHGSLGYALPRQCLVLAGWSKLRQLLVERGSLQVVQARNRGGWLFEGVHHSYMVVLLASLPARNPETDVWVAVQSRSDLEALSARAPISMSAEEVGELSDGFIIPWFEHSDGARVFDKLRRFARLASGKSWIEGRSDSRWDFSGSGKHGDLAASGVGGDGCWHVLMTRHVDQYAIRYSEPFQKHIPDPGQLPTKLGIGHDGQSHLDSDHPVVVYRYPSRNDDTRTIIATALPPAGILYSTGYVHGIATTASHDDVLALLGALNSFCCDWWARRVVDRHVTAPVMNNLPLPDWDERARQRVSSLVADLLRRNGMTRAAGRDLSGGTGDLAMMSDDEVRVAIEAEVARGFGLTAPDLAMVLSDFSDGACAAPLRELLLTAID